MHETLRPSARIRLSVRFEEFADQVQLLAQSPAPGEQAAIPQVRASTPQQAQEQLRAVTEAMANLTGRRSDMSPTAYEQGMRGLQERRDALNRVIVGDDAIPSVSTDSQFVFAIQAGHQPPQSNHRFWGSV